MWVRGLKLRRAGHTRIEDDVAPHVGAWIETFPALPWWAGPWSHPMWVRGLKHIPL